MVFLHFSYIQVSPEVAERQRRMHLCSSDMADTEVVCRINEIFDRLYYDTSETQESPVTCHSKKVHPLIHKIQLIACRLSGDPL